VPYDTIVRREPVGVIAAVIPWNSPFSAATAKLVPALLAGNTIVLKVSPENSPSMMLLAGLFTEEGLPDGVLSILPADRETPDVLRDCQTSRMNREAGLSQSSVRGRMYFFWSSCWALPRRVK
jgi:acyl-CoA reductase-like NAD-dependent aldehyde dehydrogenase